MSQLTISQVAERAGLKPSAIRYYEQIGILPLPSRMGGKRRYDLTVMYRLAIVQRARQMGFTLDEIRQLFFGFRPVTRASERWIRLSHRKMAELDALVHEIRDMQQLLRKMMRRCRCETLDQCGKGIFTTNCRDSGV